MEKGCKRAQDLMMKYMDGTLQEDEALALSAHVAVCASCKADFKVYDLMTLEFAKAETSFERAPEGFSTAVMSKVLAVPEPKHAAAVQHDRLMRIVWGLFAVLFGAGFLLVQNREAVAEFLSDVPVFGGFVLFVTPAIESFGASMAGISEQVIGGVMIALGFVTEHRFAIFGVFLALAGIFALVVARKAAVSKQKGR